MDSKELDDLWAGFGDAEKRHFFNLVKDKFESELANEFGGSGDFWGISEPEIDPGSIEYFRLTADALFAGDARAALADCKIFVERAGIAGLTQAFEASRMAAATRARRAESVA
jgi:hypothetical protein